MMVAMHIADVFLTSGACSAQIASRCLLFGCWSGLKVLGLVSSGKIWFCGEERTRIIGVTKAAIPQGWWKL
jgi:hypothetical protein